MVAEAVLVELALRGVCVVVAYRGSVGPGCCGVACRTIGD